MTGSVATHAMPFGATVLPGGVRFRIWAPSQPLMRLVLEGSGDMLPMQPLADGWHELTTDKAATGTRYRFALGDGMHVPDPASRHQPDDIHGPSEVIDPAAYSWRDASWTGRPWHEAIIYELHVGTFTQAGTFRAAIERLDHLAALGITAIELMPLADFPGARNWGYDGVLLYAPDASYGRPEDLKALIDAAHGKGLMAFLDVVYNHFGPDGNYISLYAPPIFTERHKTPWGNAINYDGAGAQPVREFAIQNALYWLEEYRFDGLRLDAVHTIVDDSPKHILTELAERVHQRFDGKRQVHLILENEENDAGRLERAPNGDVKRYTAQWNDDVHHGLHTTATGERDGYYSEYHGQIDRLARALTEGFAFQGEMMNYRGSARGAPCAHLPPTAFIAFMQNHDQIGNRAFGDRLTDSTPAEPVRAIAALYLLAPQIPMLFMGEEWAAAQPFPFFCDFEGDLAESVRNGRRAEFARFPEFSDAASRERIPDPTALYTFTAAKLDWNDLERGAHAQWLDWYRRIIAVRTAQIVPRLAKAAGHCGTSEMLGEKAFRVSWALGGGATLRVCANLSDHAVGGVAPSREDTIWSEGDIDPTSGALGAWSVLWSLEATADDGAQHHDR